MPFFLFFMHAVCIGFGAQTWAAEAQNAKTSKILIVVAHPDDEYYFAAAVYRLAQEKHARVDEIIITSGESGFHYSELSQVLYRQNLMDEQVSKKALPAIRKKEVKAAAQIMGIRESIFLDEKDFGFTRDIDETLKVWDQKKILKKISDQLLRTHYDAVFVLAPIASTHGHHKAASILALRAVAALPAEKRPLVFAGSISIHGAKSFVDADHETEVKEGRAYKILVGFPESQVDESVPVFHVDRNQSFGWKQKLNYQIVVNWMIAEHKSQGLFQTMMNRDDEEQFHLFALSGPDAKARATQFFEQLK